jgi:hypothetical protein
MAKSNECSHLLDEWLRLIPFVLEREEGKDHVVSPLRTRRKFMPVGTLEYLGFRRHFDSFYVIIITMYSIVLCYGHDFLKMAVSTAVSKCSFHVLYCASNG